jgi:prepilin-type N-terminal cleavage/methylation domain-containing protein
MKTVQKRKSEMGFTITEMMIVVAVVALLASMAVPGMARARDNARLNTIYNNLRQLEQAKSQWALDNKLPNGAPIESLDVLRSYFSGGAVPTVIRETYVPNSVGSPAEADLPAGVRLGNFAPGAAIQAPQ